MASSGKVETRLARLMLDFSYGMFTDYNRKTKKIIKTYKENPSIYMNVTPSKDELVTGKTATSFTIDFDSSLYVTMSNPLSRFRKIILRGTQSGFYWQSSLIPVYFASLNNMSMLKVYGDKAAALFDHSSDFFEKKKCMRLAHKDLREHMGKRNPAKYSSMNIVEQSSAEQSISSDTLSKIFQRQFELGYWNEPGPGFRPGTHFHDDKKNWEAVFKVAKSIYVVEEIFKERTLEVLGLSLDVTEVKVRPFRPSAQEFISPIHIMLDSPTAKKISSGKSVINGIVLEIKFPDRSNKNSIQLMLDAYVYEQNEGHMLPLVAGIMADSIFYEKSRADTNVFLDTTRILLDQWKEYVKIEEDDVKDSEILSDMFPIIVSGGTDTYAIHPLVWGFMERFGMMGSDYSDLRENVLRLVRVVHIFTEAKDDLKRRVKIGKSAEMKELERIVGHDHRDKLRGEITKLTQEIEFCKMMKRVRQETMENL